MTNEVTIRVEAKPDVDRGFAMVRAKAARLGNDMRGGFLKSGGHAGAAFAAGFIKTITFGQVGSGFAMAATKLRPQMAHVGGVLGVALGAALVVKAATAIKAGLAGGLGAGLLAGPLMYLWKTQEKAVERLKKRATDFMDTISRPVKVPFLRSLEMVGDKLKEWGPALSKALKPLAKELPGFVSGALKGIENFAKEIGKDMPSITAGFKEWGKQLPKIGKALGKMVADWIDNAPETIASVQDLVGTFEDLAEAVGAVGRAFRSFNKTNNQFKGAMEGQRLMVQKWRVKMLESILTVLEAWGLINPRMKKVADSVREMLHRAREEVNKTANHINRKKIEAKIKADKKDLEAKYRDTKARLAWLHRQKPTPKVRAEISQAKARLAEIRWQLARLRDKTIQVRVQSTLAGRGIAATKATGGIIGAEGISRAATGGVRHNRVLVGEQGPELVDLPMGSRVNSNPDTQRMMANSRGGGTRDVHLHFHNSVVAGASELQRMLVDMKRRGQLDVVLR